MSDNTAGWLDIMTGQFIPNPNYRPERKAQPKAQPKPIPTAIEPPPKPKPWRVEIQGYETVRGGEEVSYSEFRPVTKREWNTLKAQLLRGGGLRGRQRVTKAQLLTVRTLRKPSVVLDEVSF